MEFIVIPQRILVSSITHITDTHLQTHALTDKSSKQKTNDRLYIVNPAYNTSDSPLFYKLIIGLNVRI